MDFLNTILLEMTKGNFSFAILVVGIIQIVIMIINVRQNKIKKGEMIMGFFKRKKKPSIEKVAENAKKKIYIELQTSDDVKEFTDICNSISADIRLCGVDENGVEEWNTNAKSLLCNLGIANILNNKEKFAHAKEIANSIGKADWNSVYVKCDEDIYSQISKFAR